jgi:hypothetical protein
MADNHVASNLMAPFHLTVMSTGKRTMPVSGYQADPLETLAK